MDKLNIQGFRIESMIEPTAIIISFCNPPALTYSPTLSQNNIGYSCMASNLASMTSMTNEIENSKEKISNYPSRFMIRVPRYYP